ncbi:hypothetical protein BB561_001356 [Smittium simulii]|uniref:C2H2-type domain-containing protein n=1 Tax=Smittium simulii TaxID=133385 RepID=A0A2T9YV12_9FUNG|nr:hypothetical protein BB561_001356 [Smittium simulii]
MELKCKWENCTHASFADVNTLYSHITNEHIGRKTKGNLCLTCKWENCGATTTKRDHITSHIRIHIPLRPFICKKCSRPFKRSQDLKKHMKIHREGSELSFRKPLESNSKTSTVIDRNSKYTKFDFLHSQKRSRDIETSDFSLLSTNASTPTNSDPYESTQYNFSLNQSDQNGYNLNNVINTLKKVKKQDTEISSQNEKQEILQAINNMMMTNVHDIQELPNSIQTRDDILSLNQNFICMFPELCNPLDSTLTQTSISSNFNSNNNSFYDTFFDQPNSEIVTKENGLLFDDLLNQIQSSNLLSKVPIFDSPSRSIDQTAIETPKSCDVGSIFDIKNNGYNKISQKADMPYYTDLNNFLLSKTDTKFSHVSSTNHAQNHNMVHNSSPHSNGNIIDMNHLTSSNLYNEGMGYSDFKSSKTVDFQNSSNDTFNLINDPEKTHNFKQETKFSSDCNNLPSSQNTNNTPQLQNTSINFIKLLKEVGISLSPLQKDKMYDYLAQQLQQQNCNIDNNTNNTLMSEHSELYKNTNSIQKNTKTFNTSIQNPTNYNNSAVNMNHNDIFENISLITNPLVKIEQDTQNHKNSYSNYLENSNIENSLKSYQGLINNPDYNFSTPLAQTQHSNTNYDSSLFSTDLLTENNQFLLDSHISRPQLPTDNFRIDRAPESNAWPLDTITQMNTHSNAYNFAPTNQNSENNNYNSYSNKFNSNFNNYGNHQPTNNLSKLELGLMKDKNLDIDNFNYIERENPLGAMLNPSIVTTKLLQKTVISSKIGLFADKENKNTYKSDNFKTRENKYSSTVLPNNDSSHSEEDTEDEFLESDFDEIYSDNNTDTENLTDHNDHSGDINLHLDLDTTSINQKLANNDILKNLPREDIVKYAAKVLARINLLYISKKLSNTRNDDSKLQKNSTETLTKTKFEAENKPQIMVDNSPLIDYNLEDELNKMKI